MSPVRLGFGCVSLGSASSGRTTNDDVALVTEAADRGVTLFDTADVYGSGASERVLGAALGPRRGDVTIATKGGYVFRERSRWEQSARRGVHALQRHLPTRGGGSSEGGGGGGSYATQDHSAGHLRQAVEGSLRRLRTDHIDVYQLHGPGAPDPALIADLGDLVTSGKVGRFGVGAESVDAAAVWSDVDGIEVVQLPFGMLDPEAAAVFPTARARSIDVWARGVLGGGVLRMAQRDPDALATHPKRQLVTRLEGVARDAGLDIDELAMGYVLAHGDDLAAVLVGIGSRDHLTRNLALTAAPPLPADVIAAIDDAVAADHQAEEGTDG